MALAAAVAVIAFVAVKRWESERFFYRHQVELWPNPDPIDGSSSNLSFPIEFAPDGSVAIAKDHRDRILILDPSTGRIARIVSDGGDNAVNSLAFLNQGKAIVSAGCAGVVNVWDASTGFLLRTFRLSERTPVVERNANVITTTYPCNGVLVSRDGTKVLCQDVDKKLLQIWNVTTGRPDIILAGLADQNVLAFSSAGNLIALCDSSHKVSLRNIRKPASRPLFEAKPGWQVHASFSPDEEILATGCAEDVRLWNTRTGAQLRSLPLGKTAAPAAEITHLAFSVDGTTLAVSAQWRTDTWLNVVLGPSELWRESRGVVTLWDLPTGRQFDVVYVRSDASTIALSPTAEILAVGSWRGTVSLWQRSLRVAGKRAELPRTR
jgi:WD40 repeat protein